MTMSFSPGCSFETFACPLALAAGRLSTALDYPPVDDRLRYSLSIEAGRYGKDNSVAAKLKLLLSKAIKGTRFALGISQEEFAVQAGLHRTYVSGVGRGAPNPSLERLEKLATALELSVPVLFKTAGLSRPGRS